MGSEQGDSEVLMLEEVEACFVLHCGRHWGLILLVERQHPLRRRQRWVALTMAMLMRAPLTCCPQTWEQGFSHFSASKAQNFFNKVLASLQRRPSADTIRGHHGRGKVPTLLEARRLKVVFLLFLTFMGC
jgi:hypothetical protein